MKIGNRLKELRAKERSETQVQVANAIGMGDRHYQLENDDGLPGLEIFCALAEHFGVSMDYLAGPRTGVEDAGDRDARLLLRPFRTADAADVYRYAQDSGGGAGGRLASPPKRGGEP